MATTVRRGYRYVVRKENGTWPPRHHNGLDPGLVGPRAFEHPAVKEWWMWLLREYRPRASVALVTPCSSVKPYTRSPTSRKIRGLLRRLGLWSAGENRPRGIEWLYLSDLLLLVPYERAEEYPACCYELHPDEVLQRPLLRSMVSGMLAEAIERLMDRGLERAVVFLPRKHLRLWNEAKKRAARWPSETVTRYTIFGFDGLPDALNALRRVPELQELL
ncbi:hypothetical protein Pyrde_0694 [Pyrodictium delaneyi]|uniref:DUF5591 domain-containing protein n=1 Tax=Pyrodictium delaneyi TaxID=1273541 RepID=A0A0P0N3D3_9CREN|nr:hypothetical protein [Pyrodictium delaneyi]ALL00744.1 hypothetical protein Pyrde_0694 [Pyrodictium delaneyi]